MRFTMEQVAQITGGTLTGDGTVAVTGASTDSRSLQPGELFVAVVAERDGNDFLPAATAAGAAAALVSRPSIDVAVPTVQVADTLVALQALARAGHDRLGAQTIAITGSVGKTSTKDLLLSCCGEHWQTHGSAGSFNNEIGVPLTVLSAPADTDVLVLEMGARGQGHIEFLCGIARPDVAVVTSVSAAHTELFGSIDDVAVAKGELVEALAPEGTAVLNLDDPRVASMGDRTSASVLGFGLTAGDVRARDIRLGDGLRPSFVLETPAGRAPVRLGVAGAHMVTNALAATAAALAVATPLDAIVAGLQRARLSRWRMAVTVSDRGVTVINDAYNANPASMLAAFDALGATPAARRIAVMGVMAELGEEHLSAHLEMGNEARRRGFEVVSVGVAEYGGTLVADADAALAQLDALGLGRDDAILVKGSRVAGLERVAEGLLET